MAAQTQLLGRVSNFSESSARVKKTPAQLKKSQRAKLHSPGCNIWGQWKRRNY